MNTKEGISKTKLSHMIRGRLYVNGFYANDVHHINPNNIFIHIESTYTYSGDVFDEDGNHVLDNRGCYKLFHKHVNIHPTPDNINKIVSIVKSLTDKTFAIKLGNDIVYGEIQPPEKKEHKRLPPKQRAEQLITRLKKLGYTHEELNDIIYEMDNNVFYGDENDKK